MLARGRYLPHVTEQAPYFTTVILPVADPRFVASLTK
jgi:hypothetical protein